jgi:hypothetical protein
MFELNYFMHYLKLVAEFIAKAITDFDINFN